MSSRPPRPTPFPYTTLFRSHLPAAGRRRRRHGGQGAVVGPPRAGRLGSRGGAAVPGRPPRGDRKSTRLNSSHLGISYAVFCLKKKRTRATGFEMAATETITN